MKPSTSLFSIIFLLSSGFIYAMEKQQPSFFTNPINFINNKIIAYQEATKAKEQATQELFNAIREQNLDKVTSALAQGADIRATQHFYAQVGRVTPLHLAVWYNNNQIVRALLQANANLFIKLDGWFPLCPTRSPETIETNNNNRSEIVEACAQHIITKNLSREYKQFIIYIKKLCEDYNNNTSGLSNSDWSFYVKYHLEIMMLLNYQIIKLGGPHLIPNVKQIFVDMMFHLDSTTNEELILDNGLPLLVVATSESLAKLIALNKTEPDHPSIIFYKHLCNPQKDYNATKKLTPINTSDQPLIIFDDK